MIKVYFGKVKFEDDDDFFFCNGIVFFCFLLVELFSVFIVFIIYLMLNQLYIYFNKKKKKTQNYFVKGKKKL